MSDFGSGHGLTVCDFEPHIGLTAVRLSVQSLLRMDPLSASLRPPPTCAPPKIRKDVKEKEEAHGREQVLTEAWQLGCHVGCADAVGRWTEEGELKTARPLSNLPGGTTES